ncbi:MAG: putative lysine decarboxylase [candidate division WS6 bacterium OLB20]|uniref:Putative lysine decarboxylase n=1 Tax=candidate division WS6 bacterium OLB20 TaxID=1617426 RepID=A0A136LYT6_9BACT|nr:MAG: putative lysine decarboxylase [candidate division WS6 bacterium OLB20]
MPVNFPLPRKDELAPEEQQASNGRLIKRITFFGDSAIPEDDPIYKSVWEAARILAERGFAIVNGGGPGIMKAATDGAESVNGDTVAVYWQPKLASFFEGKNLANVTDESETFSNYLIRTLGLIEHGDAYVVCKGGTGTVSEFGMVWALAKLYYGCHKPVILYGEFWDGLIEAFQRDMYIDDIERGVLYQATTPEEIVNIIDKHELQIQHCGKRRFSGDEAGFVLGAEVKLTQETHDAIASSYHGEYAGRLVAQEQMEEFMSLVHPPAKVLDVGTGPGHDARFLSEKYSVTGIEISQKFAEIAKFETPRWKSSTPM